MVTKEQAERLITLIDTMVDVKTDLATATEESATWYLEEREAEAERERVTGVHRFYNTPIKFTCTLR